MPPVVSQVYISSLYAPFLNGLAVNAALDAAKLLPLVGDVFATIQALCVRWFAELGCVGNDSIYGILSDVIRSVYVVAHLFLPFDLVSWNFYS